MKMKATKEQREQVATALAPYDTPERRARYLAGEFRRDDKVKDLDKRYRWDLLYAAGAWIITTPLYESGLEDSHIDTLLRAVVPPLER